MTAGVSAPVLPDVAAVSATRPRGVLKRVLRNPTGLFSSVVLLAIVAVGLLSSVLSPFDPNLSRLELTNAPPFTTEFVLGGDQAGRDVLSRLMVATLGTLLSCVVILAVAVLFGVTTGLIAGYYPGRFDAVSSWIANAILALPGIVLLIALYTVIGPSILTAMAVFGVLIAPSYFWLVRNLVVGVRNELYVDAAKVAGLSDGRIISRHVLRAIRAPIIIQSSFVLAAGIAIQAGLEFLGLGDPSSPSWGGMLQEAFNNIYVSPANVLWPALLISLTTLCLVLLGNALRDALQAGNKVQPLRPKAVAALQRDFVAGTGDRAAAPLAPTPSDRNQPVLLTVKDLVVAYPTPDGGLTEVVHGVDLAVRRGEIHGLVGESGSGKSQTAFSILGILPREAIVLRGEITFEGHDLRDPVQLRQVRGKKIAYVPQEPMSNLDPTFTVGQQLSYGLRAATGTSKAHAQARLIALLDRVGIADAERVFHSYPHQISGGMAQRVLIAGALAADPDLIIADEPTTALDVTVQAGVLELLRELQAERDLAMVLVTHNFGVVADICDRVSVMRGGVIVESNTARALFESPQHEYTQMLLGSTLDASVLRTPLTTTTPAIATAAEEQRP